MLRLQKDIFTAHIPCIEDSEMDLSGNLQDEDDANDDSDTALTFLLSFHAALLCVISSYSTV